MLDYVDYEEYSYAQTKEWEQSLNKAEEWANKIYEQYPNIDSAKVNKVVTTALSDGVNRYSDVCSLLLK